nr:retrovirus-related Pol polyprotein from transposon TNT 1-94 [Tanacetum cinerariifolium]
MTRAKFDIKRFNGTGDFGLWRIKMRTLLIQHGCEAALEVLPTDMEAQTKADLNKKAHSVVILCLGNKVLREVTGETTAVGVWSKLETLYMTKSLANKLYLKKKLYTFYMPAGRKISEHIDEFNKIVLNLENIEDVMATLNSKEIKERSKAKGDDGEGLYVRGRTDRRDSRQSKGKLKSNSQGGSLKCYICQSEDHLKRNCPKNNRKKSTGELNASVEEKDSLAQVESLGGKRYFLSTVDDYSRRDERTVKKLRTDNGLEFCNREFEQLCIESGIARHLTVTETPQQNGVAERMNRTLIDKVRCLLIQSRLPKTFWAEATCTTAYLINRSPSRAIEKKTPMEMWSGHPSDYEMLRNVVFNESVMYKDTLKDSGAGDKSVEELKVEVELQRLNNHTPEEDQSDQEDADDEDAGDQATDQPPDLIVYQLVRDRDPRTRKKPLRAGIDYNKVFSSVVRHTSIRVILALTACKDYELKQLDVNTAFLHRNLKEVIYMKQPSGYEQGNKVCLLKKSHYGFKQSPRQWYKRFDEYMLNNGFKCSSYDSCVYYKSYAPGEYIYLLLYIDDMLIACKSKAEIRSTKSLLKNEFGMKQLGEAKKILYNGKSVKMPLGGHFKLSLKDCPVRDCAVERMSKVPYENAVESLMYLMVYTRPDIAYAVSVVSIYLANSGKNHWEAVKWILKYLRGTANVGLVYGTNRGNHVDVTCFADSDYTQDPDKGRFITGYAFLVHGCVVSWKATLQHVVALSTTET